MARPTLLPRITLALLGPVLAGIAISYGQTASPSWLLPLFNSAAPVVAVSAAAALAGRRLWLAVALGAIAGPLSMSGYYGMSALRGFAVAPLWLVFWCTAGLAVGAAMGAAIWLLRERRGLRHGPTLCALGASVWPGVALGEAAHGILRISDSTPVGYWWAEVTIGIAVLGALLVRAVPDARERTITIVATAVLAAAIFVAYGAL